MSIRRNKQNGDWTWLAGIIGGRTVKDVCASSPSLSYGQVSSRLPKGTLGPEEITAIAVELGADPIVTLWEARPAARPMLHAVFGSLDPEKHLEFLSDDAFYRLSDSLDRGTLPGAVDAEFERRTAVTAAA